MLGGSELIWIALIFFLLFGARKLPEFAKAAGESLREFKKATKEAMEEEAAPVETQRRMEAPVADKSETSTTA